jgi:hypothetical protein
MSRELLQQALDALEFPHDSEWSNKAKAIEALQHALAQPDKPLRLSPVYEYGHIHEASQPEQDWSLLAATQASLREHQARIKELEAQLAPPEQEPPKRGWVGLTDEDWENTPNTGKKGCERDVEMFNWIEQTLKDKNT